MPVLTAALMLSVYVDWYPEDHESTVLDLSFLSAATLLTVFQLIS
ncbi:hypothetical protein [Actibacterium pelagium]|nr:hypothetical protein [Actibacterium pelagium]